MQHFRHGWNIHKCDTIEHPWHARLAHGSHSNRSWRYGYLVDASAALPSVVGRELSKDECYPPLSSNRDYTPGLSKEKCLRGIDANMQLNCFFMWINTHCKSQSMLISPTLWDSQDPSWQHQPQRHVLWNENGFGCCRHDRDLLQQPFSTYAPNEFKEPVLLYLKLPAGNRASSTYSIG